MYAGQNSRQEHESAAPGRSGLGDFIRRVDLMVDISAEGCFKIESAALSLLQI
jgi:hypothetical protein